MRTEHCQILSKFYLDIHLDSNFFSQCSCSILHYCMKTLNIKENFIQYLHTMQQTIIPQNHPHRLRLPCNIFHSQRRIVISPSKNATHCRCANIFADFLSFPFICAIYFSSSTVCFCRLRHRMSRLRQRTSLVYSAALNYRFLCLSHPHACALFLCALTFCAIWLPKLGPLFAYKFVAEREVGANIKVFILPDGIKISKYNIIYKRK